MTASDRQQRWDAPRASVARMTDEDWADYANEGNPERVVSDWDGVTVAPEWQDEWNEHLRRNGQLAAPPVDSNACLPPKTLL